MKTNSISVIIALCNEEGNIRSLYEELTSSLKELSISYQTIFIDDGSTDGSFGILEDLARSDEHVEVVKFKRNFGQTAATAAGFNHATGEVIVTMDGDLQNDPKDIRSLLEKLDEGYDLVCGWRKKRKDRFFTRIVPSYCANKLISTMTGVRLHDCGCTLKAYRSSIVKGIKLYGEMHRFLPVLASWEGARIAELEVGHRARRSGKTKYGLMRTAKVLLDIITIKFLSRYSTKPMYFFGAIGFACLFGAMLSGIALMIRKIFFGFYLIESPLLLLTILLTILSAIFIMMGLLAEMFSRLYHESQNKPTYAIDKILSLRKE
ncbi:MAG: glycosyltransferase family 2 protein [Candidatus Omnitrophica bacterium]|nr:glycosyltransferase family 2 protein [Candidatus Omnitrophota bacterium]